MVVGAGISGIQSALDLAEGGFKVYLLEKSPAIGGVMPMLDKTFPTNDCSMCILSPKLVECGRHHNIEIITQADIVDLQGEPGNFSVTVLKQPRFVDLSKCIGCGACAQECPEEILSEYNQGLGMRNAIYKPYAQAFPNAFVIDKENCLECMACVDVCQANAIDHEMTEEKVVIEVGAIILSPGFTLFEPALRGEYGFGIYKNVLSSLQFERMLSASGPFQGHIQRPSDGAQPKKIAFIQCVGSRDITRGSGYCSGVCCMYATKEAIIAKEHQTDLDVTIFYIDLRAYGKDFEKYYNRAQNDYGVRYVRSMLSTVKEFQQTKNLLVTYSDSDNQLKEEEFDMVILSAGLKPNKDAQELADVLKIDLNDYNFCQSRELSGVATSREGIYTAGAFSGPKDIPETVMQASAAAADASVLLATERNKLVQEKTFPPERSTADEELRIGVFVCHCGINIGSVVNVPAVVEAAGELPNVVHAQESLYVCSQDTQIAMKELIAEKGLNRVVVASCSTRTHKPLFQETMKEAGLNRHLFEMANIRDQCSWVHMHEPEMSTAKAIDLVKAAVKKAELLEPLKQTISRVTKSALVVGGGVAGMTAALEVARQGYKVFLVEKTAGLGGNALKIAHGMQGEDVQGKLKELISDVTGNPLIEIRTNCEITEVAGFTGNFISKLSTGKEIEHGAVIISSGGREYTPDEYLYKQDKRILTQMELEELIDSPSPELDQARNIVFIQCVGSREDNRQYCSRVCCSKTMKQVLALKRKKPELNIFVLYRDIRTYGFLEDQYREARRAGVMFIRYDLENKPVVNKTGENGRSKLSVSLTDQLINEQIEINPDLVVLASAILSGESNKKISQLFKVPLNADGFFLEAHMKLRPVDFPADGLYVCGLAHSPKNIEESITQAKAAAGRAATILNKNVLESKGVTAHVQTDKCQACLTCVRLCPYNAPRIKDNVAEIEAVVCQGCGTCAGECPNKAITLQGYTDTQQMNAIQGIFH